MIIKDGVFLAVINEEPSKTGRKLYMEFNISHVNIFYEIVTQSEVSKAGKWIPRDLTKTKTKLSF